MKISKTAVLTAGSALMMAGLGLMFVSAADKNLYVDPNNAIQHFEKVRIVPTESGDNSMADIVKKGNLFGIETDYNFALSRSGTDANQISENTMGSSILGGIVNKILGGIYNGILGGKTNKITTGNNNGILGGENNEIGGNYSVIFGGMGNEIGSGSYSAIVGGSGNKTNGSYLAVVGRNNNARGYNSVAMGSGKLNATSSFLWTDGIYSGNFTTNHVFAVLGDKGMVINATGAHDLAQLTISGSLVVYDDKNAPVCNNDTKGVLKVVDGNASNTNQKCFCSCDGSGRNSLYESSKCPEICSNETTRTGDRCGGVERDCGNNPYIYTGNAVSGACVYGELVNGTGAFLVSTEKSGGVLTNYINRSCQSSNGEVRICRDELKGEGCPNHYTGECLWREGTDTGHIVLSENKSPESTAEYWEYSITGVNNGELCKYKCDDESERDPVEKRCVPFECEGVLETGAVENNPGLLPKSHGVEYVYAPGSGAACTYYCTGDYHYNPETEKCELCPEGLVFINGGCRPVCDVASTKVQDLELFLIGGSGDISHYMMMDRNLGATEIYNQKGKNLQNLGSYGCYFQWGNNYGFSTGAATTTGQVNPASFGPSQYSNDKFYCYTSGYNDPSLYTSINWHIWGGGWRKSNGWSNGSDGTDIDRQGPCPAGYHVPRGKEMDDLLDDWGNANSSRENKGDAFASHILMPYGTYMEVWCGWQNRTRNGGGVWLSDGYNKNGGQYIEVEIHDDGPTFRGISQTHGMQVRCVKNNLRDIPSKVSVHPDGGTEAVIAIDWESGENGKITTLGEPKKDGYDFGGWYYNESLTTEIKVGDSISNGGNIYAKWIAKECDVASTKVQDLELFMLSYTGNISHYMMMDRNLGATEVYNQNYGSSNQTSFGCYFQWGNNYPFHGTNIARTQVQANVDGYGPDNYYSRGLFFCNTDEHPINRFPKEGSDWKDLRGGITNTEISKKGPCPEGYHIPHNTEIEKLINEWESATTITGGRQLANDMLTPFAGGISPRCDEGYRNDNRAAGFWMANARSSTDNICHLSLGNFTNGEVVSCRTNSAVHSFPVRCVKNNQAAISQKITINANGGTGAVISVDWETTNQGRIVALGTPTKAGYTFGGWYKDASFKNRVYKGDTISANGHLYAKWVSNTCEITITYDPRGGTLQRSSDTQKIDCGTKVTLPSATKTGSVFVAWWDLSNGTRAGGAGDPYTGGWTDVTLFATWNEQSQPEENITIGCNIPVKWCDNTIPSVTGFDAINYKITAGSAPFPIYVYTKVNYIAWNSLDLSYEVKDGNSGRLRHIISGGKCNRQSNWDEGYKPAFAATNCAENGGSSDYAPEYASLSPGSQVTQKTVTYDGKKYKISLVCSMQSPRINSCNKNFTVTYDANGGVSVSKSTASVYYNKSVDLTPIATGQDGYKFIGWNTSSTATTALSSYTMPCDNLRLYAIYQKQNTNPIDITITCKANYETKKPSSANACVDTTLVSTTYTANQNLPVDVYIAQQEFVKGVYGSCKYQPQDEGGGVYKINSGSKTSTRVSGAVSMGRDSVQGYDGLLWHGLSSFVDSSWATKPRLDVSYNFPQTMTKEHTASNGQKYNIILQDCVPYGGTTQCVNYSQYKECTDGITGTPLTSTDSSKLKWKCGTSTCEMCNESDGYTLQNGACVKNRCEGGNELPSYNTNIYKYNPISVDGVTPWKYVAPSDSLVPCSWTCASGYSINSTKTECIKNPVCNYTNKSNLRENQTFCEEGGREVNAELKFRPDGITPYRSYQCESNGITVYCEKDTLYTEISGPEWNGDTLQDNISLHGNAASSIYGIKYNFQSASSSAQDGPEKVIGINQTNASLHSSYPGPLKFVKWNPDSYLGNINKPQFKVNGSYINASYSELGYLVVPYNNGGSKDIAIIPNNVASIYTIRFHPEGGKGTMPDQIVECGKSFTLNKNQFTNAGSEFDEWRVFTGENWGYCASNNLDYICALGDEDEIDSLDIQDDFICGSTIDLYAAWTATPVCTPSITYGAGTITANDCNTTITIADKNVGATVAGFGPTSYGKYFRRGNNVGFTLNELGGKNGGNIEEGYIKYFDRDRWDLGGTITGPCGNGYHVPSKGEWDKLYKVYYNIKNYNGGSLNIASFEEKFKLPNNGYVKKGYGDTITDNTLFYLHSSSYRTTAGVGNIEDIEENLAGKGSLTPYWAGTYGGNNYDEITAFFNATTNDAGALMPIRCFKD